MRRVAAWARGAARRAAAPAPRRRAARCRPAGGTDRRASACTVCDVSSVPPGASTSCAAARSWSPDAQQRAHHHAIDVGLGGERLEIRAPRRAKRAAVALERTIERADARQRRRDRVGQAEREEVGLADRGAARGTAARRGA